MKRLYSQLKKKSGFAMLFTVLIISLMLAIGLGISDLTYKQTLLSSLAQDSQLAFYQADSGVECGLYYNNSQFSRNTYVSTSAAVAAGDPGGPTASLSLTCGNTPNNMSLVAAQSYTNYFVYQENVAGGTTPCFSITFDKTDPVKDSVSASGFSTCQSTPQQVERGLNVTY
jgi:Tfp pilus assembly protein PilX